MNFSDDQSFIDRVLTGDKAAFRFLVDRNKKIVYSIALRILGDKEDAMDAAQESFIRAYDQLHTFKGKSKFSTWLYTITYRICVSRLEANSIKKNSIDCELTANYADHTNDPHEKLAEKENQMLIKEAIAKLPKTDALLVMLYYYNENSIREIEEITGLSPSNIKIKLFRARKILEHDLKFLI
jgi:RNA polymerase sigma-70 factor (ECF subfamily)